MTETQRENALRCFANIVLNELQETADWDADMLDRISSCAMTLGLAQLGQHHEFKRAE